MVCLSVWVHVASCTPTSWASRSWRAPAHPKSWSLCSTSSSADSMRSPRCKYQLTHPEITLSFPHKDLLCVSSDLPDSLSRPFLSICRGMGVFALRSWGIATIVCLVCLTPFPPTPRTVLRWGWTCALPSGQFISSYFKFYSYVFQAILFFSTHTDDCKKKKCSLRLFKTSDVPKIIFHLSEARRFCEFACDVPCLSSSLCLLRSYSNVRLKADFILLLGAYSGNYKESIIHWCCLFQWGLVWFCPTMFMKCRNIWLCLHGFAHIWIKIGV